MKKNSFLLLLFIIIALSACKLESDSNSTPNIRFAYYPINSTKSDTLTIRESNKSTPQNRILIMDTIEVGDTVRFGILFNAYTNNLTSLSITQSADSISRIILPSKSSLDSVFASISDYAQGKFTFKIKTNNVYIPFKYIARKASVVSGITFTVSSDAKFENNNSSIELITPIRLPKTIN